MDDKTVSFSLLQNQSRHHPVCSNVVCLFSTIHLIALINLMLAIISLTAPSYGAAMKVVGNADRQETGRWCNNRAENSHLPLRRRERAMLRFRQMRCLQKFAAVHSSVYNHFNQERHFYSRDNFKLNRTAALTEWRQLLSA
jgi:putative transposase